MIRNAVGLTGLVFGAVVFMDRALTRVEVIGESAIVEAAPVTVRGSDVG